MAEGDARGRLVRMYGAAARINRAILRADSPDFAYDAACRLSVESGLFDLAWIGHVDRFSERLRPVARFGYAEALVDHFCDGGESKEPISPAWRALSESRVVVSNDLSRDEPWVGRGVALATGLRSMACLPLCESGRAIGVFALYSTRVGRFDDALLELLAEVVDDLTFSLAHMLQEQQSGFAAAARAHYLAYYSPQTGLPNRALLEQRMHGLAAADDACFSVLSVKLERVEAIARVFGTPTLDELLRTLAQRLERDCGNDGAGACIVAQIAHDEFALAVPGVGERAVVAAFARRVTRSLSAAVPVPGGSQVVVGTRIGAVVFPEDEGQPAQLLAHARAAAANALPNGEPAFHHPVSDADSEARLNLEAELHHALERDEFELEYQPQLNLATGAIVGVEALLRWRHPARGLLQPGAFVTALERSGLMSRVGEWVLRTACLQHRAWSDAGLPVVRMAVNVSAQQLRYGGLAQTVREVLRTTGMPGHTLELELTEGLVLDDAEQAIAVMQELKKLGVELSLDDFGTGYSSLSYLRRLPVDRIKIDQSFVREIASDPGSATLVRAIIAMARSLGLTTVAEGVEHEAQLGYLRKHGCTEMQGYLFSASVAAAEIAAMLRQDRRLAVPHDRSASGSTVLVVDDEPGIQAALRRALRRDGITVLVAESAGEALAILATTDVGVILCDQRMPVVTGAEFLDAVKGLYPDSIRILLTGYTEVSTLIDAVNRGAVSKVLTKPWDDDQLRAHVAEALRHYEATRENRRLSLRLERITTGAVDADA